MTKSGASLVKYPCGLQGLLYTVLSLVPIFVFDIKNFRPLDQTVGGGSNCLLNKPEIEIER